MNQFTPLLKQLNSRLDLPQPQKSRILLEISADLNDLYDLYVSQGHSREEAKQRAEIKFDFDERKYFLNVLTEMSVLECDILDFLYKQSQPTQIRSISKLDTDPYAIYGSINKLRSYGFIESRRGSYMMNGKQDEHLDDIVFVSGFGKKFIKYVKNA